MDQSSFRWRVIYAVAGALIVPMFGRLALAGSGHELELYRYLVPLFVGLSSGFLIGRFKDEILAKNESLRLEAIRANNLSKALRANEEYLRAILDNAPIPIYLKKIDTFTYLLVNRMAEMLVGLPPNRVIGRTDFEIWEPDIAQQLREQDLKVIEQKTTVQFETHIMLQGEKRFFITYKFPVKDEDGNIYAIGGMCLDITQRKRAEDKLAEEEERLSVTLRNIGDGVVATDIHGRVVLVNKVAEVLTGWSEKEARGRMLQEIMKMENADDGSPVPSPVDAVIKGNAIMALPEDVVLVARDGTRRLIEDTCSPVRDRESRIIGVVLVFRDVTHVKQMEEELLKTRNLESLGVLAGGIAHDFNNLLAAILGNINLASLLVGPGHEASELLKNAEDAARRARDLTRQLLTFAKGGTPIKKVASIAEFVRDTAEFVTRGSNVAVECEFPDDIWLVEFDAAQMGQVIQNLVINAMQAMPDGGVIRISCENVISERRNRLFSYNEPSRYVCLRIEDQGVGIPEDVLEKVFDPFFSTKQQGSGLGLAIVHSIIRKHGGHVAVESEPGSGTAFTIMLPALEDASVDESNAGSAVPENVVEGDARGTVLIMDDEDMVRDVASEMIRLIGYRVLTASDGSEALEIYKAEKEKGNPVSAVILDLTIHGGMGGLKCVKKLLEYDPDAVCIVSSGYSNDDVMANYERYGFRGVLIKPFDLAEMSRTLKNVTGQ